MRILAHQVERGATTTAVGLPKAEGYWVYPNPAREVLQVEGGAGRDAFEIFTPTGITLRKGMLSDGRIPVSTLPAGLYYLRIGRWWA
ncbi:MAG: T9SS type A sorting domain-containing protein [Phaeodactylibacter sp.]|uniref:T9SS type A sorting domain-containing protein n=1 Tax=Phaeodactylibacter sp. TaxID=1940289 RepID=UPI0032EB4EB0